jgi:hypothetical protein
VKRLAVLAAAAAAIAAGVAPVASSAVRHDQLPLHVRSSGLNVAELKYLIRDPRPKQNSFTKVKGTYEPSHGMGGWWNAALSAAVYDYKYRLGYPSKYNSKTHPIAGVYFFGLLRGKAHRPASWISAAAARVKAIEAATPTKLALAIEKVERSQLGVSELCCDANGNSWNAGPQIDRYFAYFHLPVGLAYCVIGQQWSFAQAGFRPPFANGTFAAYGTADYYAAHNLLFAKPRRFALVIFVDYDRNGHRISGTGHEGFVVQVTASGYYSIEFNTGFGRDAGVRLRLHGFHDRGNVFAYVPHVTTP